MTPFVLPDDLHEDGNRRLWLGGAPVSGGMGLIATEVPFAVSPAPSEKARALGTPIEVDVGSLRPSELWTVERRGKQVFVLRRTPEMFDAPAIKYRNAFSAARDAMLTRTHTATTPWRIVPADNKRLARLNLMRDILARPHYAGRKDRLVRSAPTSCLSFLPISSRRTA